MLVHKRDIFLGGFDHPSLAGMFGFEDIPPVVANVIERLEYTRPIHQTSFRDEPVFIFYMHLANSLFPQ